MDAPFAEDGLVRVGVFVDAVVARESLQTVSGTVTQASEVTVKRKRRSTKHYYEISVQPDTAGAEVRKLRIDYSTPQQLVGNLIDEKVTALVDSSDNDLVYEVSAGGTTVISYDTTKQRLQAEATSSAQSMTCSSRQVRSPGAPSRSQWKISASSA
mgnify:CR=1 FL=1